MPQLEVKTTSAEKVWEKGDLAIFKIALEYDGKSVEAKTYSKAIAVVGWSGTVETYEKEGRNGSETFVKQPQKEGGWQSGGGGQAKGGYSKAPTDSYTMYLSYVKDIAVALINNKAYTTDRLNEIANDVATTGEMFYAMRPSEAGAKALDATPKQDVVVPVDDDVLANINEVFGKEDKWTEPS